MRKQNQSEYYRLMRNAIGGVLRERRKALGLTLSEVAEKVGRSNLSLGYLSQIETGKNNTTLPLFFQICEALGTDVAELLVDAKQLYTLKKKIEDQNRLTSNASHNQAR